MSAAAFARSRHALPNSSVSCSSCLLFTTCQPPPSTRVGNLSWSSTPRFRGGGEVGRPCSPTTGSESPAESANSVSMACCGVAASARRVRTSAASSIGNMASRSLAEAAPPAAARIAVASCARSFWSVSSSRWSCLQRCWNSSFCAGFADGDAPGMSSGISKVLTFGAREREAAFGALAAEAAAMAGEATAGEKCWWPSRGKAHAKASL
mmetsp:Transcript_99910/g.223915  ORF Transcript_99910/g.223915 Transcript_99910/m.223915 type:complete len:209 (+) Transcript_99910:202-828(+)